MVTGIGSQGGTRSYVQRWSERDPRIHLVPVSARRDAAAARNIGVQSARGGLFAFRDAEDAVRPGWVAAMRAALADANLVAGCSTSAHWTSPEFLPGSRGHTATGFSPFGLSANVAVPREVFDGLQGFDEELSPEDVDLCWRLQLAGHRFALATDAVVEKRERAGGLPTFRGAWADGRCGPQPYVRCRAEGMRRDL